MRKIRKHLSFANVIASMALFIALGGASYAATQLPKNSVGTKQLKKNAVKSAKLAPKAVKTNDLAPKAVKTGKLGGEAVKAGKIAKNAIAGNRLRDAVVSTEKLGDAAVTGAKINAPTTPFGRIVANLGGNATAPFGGLYPLSSATYTQLAGRLDQFFASVTVKFPAGCTAPRSAAAYLLLDAATPESPTTSDLIGFTVIEDKGGGDITREANFGAFPGAGSGASRVAPAANTPHTFAVLLASESCTAGSGVTATGAKIQVVGTK